MDDIRTELIELLSEEFRAAGIDNSVVQPTYVDIGQGLGTTVPAQMVVPLDADRFGRTPSVHVYFLPVLDDPPVIQFMVVFPYELDPRAGADVCRFVALVNSNLPITGFELNEDLRQIVFRHTHAIGTAPLDPGVVAWPLTIIRHAVESYAPLIEIVANGGDYDTAVTAFVASYERLTG